MTGIDIQDVIRALQAENAHLRRVANCYLSFVCAHCGALADTVVDAIENGAQLECNQCGKMTVVELFTPVGYMQRHAQQQTQAATRTVPAHLRDVEGAG